MVDGDILVPDPTTGWEKRRSLALEMDATAARPKRGNGEGVINAGWGCCHRMTGNDDE